MGVPLSAESARQASIALAEGASLNIGFKKRNYGKGLGSANIKMQKVHEILYLQSHQQNDKTPSAQNMHGELAQIPLYTEMENPLCIHCIYMTLYQA